MMDKEQLKRLHRNLILVGSDLCCLANKIQDDELFEYADRALLAIKNVCGILSKYTLSTEEVKNVNCNNN